MNAQRTTQLENGACKLFPLPPPAQPMTPWPSTRGGVGYFHLFSFGLYHFPTVLDAEQPATSSPEAGECQRWVADLALLRGITSMGLPCPGLGSCPGSVHCPKGSRVRDHVPGTLSPPPPAPRGRKSPLFPGKQPLHLHSLLPAACIMLQKSACT